MNELIFKNSGGELGLSDTNYITTKKYNLLDYTTWTVGSGSIGSFIEYLWGGNGGCNYRINSTGPYGENMVLWEASGTTTGTTYNFGGMYAINNVIDLNKDYRYSVWMRRTTTYAAAADRSCYIGPECKNIGGTIVNSIQLSPTGVSTNYWAISTLPDTSTNWFLCMFVIRNQNYSTTSDVSGFYSTDGTDLGIGGGRGDAKFSGSTYYLTIRLLAPYNTTISPKFQIAYPRLDLLDGSEPTFQELITGKPLLGIIAGYEPNANTLLYYNFDNGIATNFNGVTGTTSAVTFTDGTYYGKRAQFATNTGTTSWIKTNFDVNLAQDFTTATWLYYTQPAVNNYSSYRQFWFKNSTGSGLMAFMMESDKRTLFIFSFATWATSGGWYSVTNNIDYVTGPMFIGIVGNLSSTGNTQTFYTWNNGSYKILNGTYWQYAGASQGNGIFNLIGADNATSLRGYIDEFIVENRKWSAAEMTAYINQSKWKATGIF